MRGGSAGEFASRWGSLGAVLVVLAAGCGDDTAPAAGQILRPIGMRPVRDAAAPGGELPGDGGAGGGDAGVTDGGDDRAFGFDEFAVPAQPAAATGGLPDDDGGADRDCTGDAASCERWVCRFEQQGGDDGCNCGCGAPDPDCRTGEGCSEPGCRARSCRTCRSAHGAPMGCAP